MARPVNPCILNSNLERLTVMKKIIIAMLAVLGTVAMVSCEQEKSFNDTIGENSIVLSMQGAPSTRSMEVGAIIEKGMSIDLGKDEEGNQFFLEETIQDLNSAWAPATKGTPVYTENVGVLYEKMGAYIGGANYELYSMDNEEGTDTGSMVGGGWRYQLDNFDAWPTNGSALDFYLWMPTSGNGITGTPTYGKTTGENPELYITFNYQSETTAADQKDLIFAARPISKQDALDNRVNGVPVLFNHALTGVKFAIANYDADKNITIKSISFKGLYDKGTCTITPATEDDYRNEFKKVTIDGAEVSTPVYSSGDGRVVWSGLDKTGRTLSSGEFKNDNVVGKPIDFSGGSFTNNGKYPSSFSDAGNENNLNDGNASQTFWLIPQAISNAVKLSIEYTVGSETGTWDIDFGAVLAAKKVVWEAGELRTYTIKLDEVNVKITDEVHMTGGSYTKDTKNNIHISNTGNTDAFIRAAIVGQWLNSAGQPVFGFTDKLYNFYQVESWYEDQFVKSTTGTHGTFTDLAGYKGGDNPTNGWYLCTDGYYYYSNPVAPDKVTGKTSGGTYVEEKLFTSYTIGTAPEVTISGVVQPIHFSLEISTQAISAKKIDGSSYSWQDAWENATGTKPTIKN